MSANSRKIITTADGSPSILDEAANVTFHSRHGALAESMHVFIRHGLDFAFAEHEGVVNVLEVGFGTGLNAALTWLDAERAQKVVHYTGIEKFPLPASLSAAYAAGFDQTLADRISRVHADRFSSADGIFSSELIVADFNDWLPGTRMFHLVYFDAFGPGSAPELWTESNFRKLYACMLPGACLVTFCAQGEMRRRLRRAGFATQRLPGAPGKREMTRALRPGAQDGSSERLAVI